MPLRPWCWLPPLFALLCALPAQAERYELGLRLREFERQLGACTQPALQHAALEELDRAVQAFFRLDTRGVAKAIDDASLALRADAARPGERLARSLQVELAARLVGPGAGGLAFQLRATFPVDEPLPQGLRLSFDLAGTPAPLAEFAIAEVPFAGELPLAGLPAGDHRLCWRLTALGQPLVTREQGLSVAADLAARLTKLDASAGRSEGARDVDSASLPAIVRMLHGMTRRRAEETVLPGASLLVEAEALSAAIAAGKPFYGPAQPGQHWLRVPTGKSTASVRMFSPDKPAAKAPLVVALHGAGGSENLFFDGYGDGALARLCAERGWFLVAPRSDGFGGVEVAALVDALAARWDIDPARVAVVGHSMGAGQAIANAMRTPARFRAIAALGGGGAVRRSPELAQLPFFVGVGERDFARRGAEALHRQLEAAGAPSRWREYPHVEHLAIVQFALPDVMQFFAEAFGERR